MVYPIYKDHKKKSLLGIMEYLETVFAGKS